MGARVTHLCPKCNYSAEVSGGPDGGFVCGTQTFVCLECKELFDLIITTHRKRPRRKTPHCPNGKEHTLLAWKTSDACPKCHAPMEPRPDLGCTLWD